MKQPCRFSRQNRHRPIADWAYGNPKRAERCQRNWTPSDCIRSASATRRASWRVGRESRRSTGTRSADRSCSHSSPDSGISAAIYGMRLFDIHHCDIHLAIWLVGNGLVDIPQIADVFIVVDNAMEINVKASITLEFDRFYFFNISYNALKSRDNLLNNKWKSFCNFATLLNNSSGKGDGNIVTGMLSLPFNVGVFITRPVNAIYFNKLQWD